MSGCSIRDAVQIYTNMPRDPRRAAGIDCSREGLSGAKVITFLYTAKRFREKVNLFLIFKQRYMGLIIDDTLISNQEQNLRAAMSTDPKMRKVIQQHIREALFAARREVMNSINFENGDPRHSAKAIRTSVYEKVLGGNINILTGKTAHGGGNSYEPPRKSVSGRGGNRRKRSERTKQIMSYSPLDRGFILRFVNSGTKTRVIGFRNTVKANRGRYERAVTRIHSGDKFRTGNRGSIAARNWFMQSAESSLGNAAQNIADMIAIEAAAIINGDT